VKQESKVRPEPLGATGDQEYRVSKGLRVNTGDQESKVIKVKTGDQGMPRKLVILEPTGATGEPGVQGVARYDWNRRKRRCYGDQDQGIQGNTG